MFVIGAPAIENAGKAGAGGWEDRPKLTETRQVVEHAIVEIRRILAALSPAVLEQLGLAAAIRQLTKRFQAISPRG